MPGNEQERFAEYLELEYFLADLQAGKTARLPKDLTPARARLYHMALLFHAASPGASELRPEFIALLRRRLEEELQAVQKGHRPKRPSSTNPGMTRRRLLSGGAVVATSAAVGVGSGWLVEQVTQQREPLLTNSPTEWFFVTTVATLGNQAVQFTGENLIGYVVRRDGGNGNPAEHGEIFAVSAACPHMGCLVQWTGTDRTFRCPCHEAAFTQDGEADTRSSPWRSLTSLPRLEVKVEEDGKIFVRMPAR